MADRERRLAAIGEWEGRFGASFEDCVSAGCEEVTCHEGSSEYWLGPLQEGPVRQYRGVASPLLWPADVARRGRV